MTQEWYALKTKPNREDLLYSQLLTRGFEAYFPRLDVNPVNPRARKTRPYFPGYMFVHVAIDEVGLSTFQWMPYAIGLVGFDRVPAMIPNDVMQALVKSIEVLKGKEKKSVPFESGSTLLVNGGPFAGYEAIFDTSLPGHDRIRVLLLLVQGNRISVELPAYQVQLKN